MIPIAFRSDHYIFNLFSGILFVICESLIHDRMEGKVAPLPVNEEALHATDKQLDFFLSVHLLEVGSVGDPEAADLTVILIEQHPPTAMLQPHFLVFEGVF